MDWYNLLREVLLFGGAKNVFQAHEIRETFYRSGSSVHAYSIHRLKVIYIDNLFRYESLLVHGKVSPEMETQLLNMLVTH